MMMRGKVAVLLYPASLTEGLIPEGFIYISLQKGMPL